MSELVVHIKSILDNLHGVFIKEHRPVPDELNDMYQEVYSDKGMKQPSNDKANLKGDINRVKKDFSKALEEYKEEH